jgi:hypothetical protein
MKHEDLEIPTEHRTQARQIATITENPLYFLLTSAFISIFHLFLHYTDNTGTTGITNNNNDNNNELKRRHITSLPVELSFSF